MNYFYLLLLLNLALFIFLTLKERRTIFYGISLVLLLTFLNAGILVMIEKSSNTVISVGLIVFLLLMTVLFTVLISIGPLVLALTLIIEGYKNFTKEGFAIRNILAVSIGLFFIFSPYITHLLIQISNNNLIVVIICNAYRLIVAYLIIVASAFTLSSLLNFINFKRNNLDYIVVLGAGLNYDQVTPLLASRIDKGIAVYNKQKNCKLIMSGGQGSDEYISEAEAMKRYALTRGVESSDIILEENSTSTLENIKYSVQLMKENPKFAIVTNYYHLFRALLLANKLDVKCIGYGSNTKFYFALNAFVREFIGYLAVKYKLHVFLISLMIIIYISVICIMNFYK